MFDPRPHIRADFDAEDTDFVKSVALQICCIGKRGGFYLVVSVQYGFAYEGIWVGDRELMLRDYNWEYVFLLGRMVDVLAITAV